MAVLFDLISKNFYYYTKYVHKDVNNLHLSQFQKEVTSSRCMSWFSSEVSVMMAC